MTIPTPPAARWRDPTPRPISEAESKGDRASVSPGSWTDHLVRRFSLRFRLHDDPAHPFSEAVGVLMSVTHDERGEVLSFVHRSGKTFTIHSADVLAAKLFPSA